MRAHVLNRKAPGRLAAALLLPVMFVLPAAPVCAATLQVLPGASIQAAIDAAAHQPGVKEVIIRSPAVNIVCAAHQAPYCTHIAVSIDGVES